jgi:hypothetical protein
MNMRGKIALAGATLCLAFAGTAFAQKAKQTVPAWTVVPAVQGLNTNGDCPSEYLATQYDGALKCVKCPRDIPYDEVLRKCVKCPPGMTFDGRSKCES